MQRNRITSIAAIGAAAAIALTGCATGNQTEGGSGEGSGDSLGTITLGFLPSWTDGLSTAYLLENQLEQLGYTVEMQELTEAGPLYTGLAQGDVDIYPSAWPELTHASYMEEYGDDIDDLGTYYEGASLNLSVPSYVDDVTTIDDLVGQADRFGGQIIGIEPGAGLTAQTQTMMPEAGLDDYELVTSSTAAMLAELDTAIASERDIVVTSWAPYWANEAYDLRALEDPDGLMGGTEGLHFLGTAGFADEFPEAADYIAGIQLTDEQYASLEDMVVNEYGEGREAEAVEAWLEANPEAFDTIVVE